MFTLLHDIRIACRFLGRNRLFAHVIAGDARDANLTYAARPERVRAAVITPNAFAMLGVPALAGRTLTDADARPGAAPVVVVSFRFWQTRLGADPGAVGRTLRIAEVPYAIAGVMPEGFVFWGRDLWMPLTLDPADARTDRRYYVQAQLRPGVGLDAAAARLNVLAARLAADHPEQPEYAGLGIGLNVLVVTRDPGYRAAGIWTARIALPSATAASREGADVYARILARLRETPGVTGAALTSAFPIGELPTRLVSAESGAAAQRMASLDAALMVVSPDFFRLLGVPIAEGRAFADADDRTRPPVAIVSRALAARLWPDGRAVGRRLAIGAGDAIVVGIARDVEPMAGGVRAQPALFLPIAQRPPAEVAIALRSADPARALAAVDAAVREVDASLPVYEPEMLAQSQLAALGPKLLAVTLLGIFGAAVLALSSLGIYAVVSQSVQERGQELRIRLTFGAEPRRLFRTELWRAARLVIVSAAAGGGAALAALRLLASAFTGFTGSIALPLAASTALLVAIALAATAIPAYQACRLDVLNRA